MNSLFIVILLLAFINVCLSYNARSFKRFVSSPLIHSNKLSMFSNDGSVPKVDEITKESTGVVENQENKEESNNKNVVAEVGFKIQDLLTYGLIAWTIYLVGDSIRIVAFPPPQV